MQQLINQYMFETNELDAIAQFYTAALCNTTPGRIMTDWARKGKAHLVKVANLKGLTPGEIVGVITIGAGLCILAPAAAVLLNSVMYLPEELGSIRTFVSGFSLATVFIIVAGVASELLLIPTGLAAVHFLKLLKKEYKSAKQGKLLKKLI